MKKLFLYPLVLCFIFCFYGCEDKDSCNDCEGLCCYKDFSSPIELSDEIELDLDADGDGDVLIRDVSNYVSIKGMSSNVEVSTGIMPVTLPSRPYATIYENAMLNYGWEWKNSLNASVGGNTRVGDYIGVRFKGTNCYYYGWIKVGYVSKFKVYAMYLYKGVNDPVYAGVKNPNCN